MKVYINIPGQAIAGGVESLYQLADAINNTGGESIVLWDNNYLNPIPEKYKNYNITESKYVEDSSENWIIYPEVWTDRLHEYKNIRKAIWWLSVDNNHGKFKDFEDPNIYHFYQSYYALEYLLLNKTSVYLPLFDYIPKSYIENNVDLSKKIDIICYNPVKGNGVTNQIKLINPNIEFVPIAGMSETQVIDILSISKIYIDFGHHPGRDRIPREAAILGNCVITNRLGSAGFYNDIPINSKYKVSDVSNTPTLFEDCLKNYDETIKDFKLYRNNITQQKDQLYNLTKQYFI